MFFTKTGKGGTKDVWFYDMQADGFSLDDKRQEVAENDIPDILHRWNHLTDEQSRTRTDQSFFVPVADIRANHYDLSLNRYKEVVYESRAYESPQEIIRQIKQTDAERQHLLAALEADLDLPGL